jgi:hypothetical protein
MRDVNDQLADYFDATVERITAEDVLAGVRVRAIRPQEGAPQRPDVRPAPRRPAWLRPAWATGVAFVTTLVVISGSLGVGLLMRSQATPVGAGGTALDGGGADTTLGWTFMIGTAVALAVLAIALLARGRVVTAGRNGGRTMTTTIDKPAADDRVHRLENRSRTLTIAVIVLAILAIGLGAWAVYQATTAEDLGVPEDVAAITDDWFAALARHDGSVVDLYTPNGYHEYGAEIYRGEAMAVHLGGQEGSITTGTHEWTSNPVVLVDTGDRWVVVRAMHIAVGGSNSESTLSYEIVRMDDGSLKIAQSSWLIDHAILYGVTPGA